MLGKLGFFRISLVDVLRFRVLTHKLARDLSICLGHVYRDPPLGRVGIHFAHPLALAISRY